MPYVALPAKRPRPASRWGGRVRRLLAHIREPPVPPSPDPRTDARPTVLAIGTPHSCTCTLPDGDDELKRASF